MQYSIVNYKTVKENSDFRIDAEYYHPIYLVIHEKIKSKNNVLFFSKIKKISSGKNLPQIDNGKYKFIRTQNIRPILIDDSGMSETDNVNNLKLLKKGDMLFVRVGEGVGNSSIVTENYSKNAFSDNILKLEIKEINPFFCSVFFNSTIGQTYFKRVFKGTARSLISQENFKDIFIPVFNDFFQNLIQSLIEKSQEFIKKSKFLYSQAEQLLLSELELLNWKPKHELAFVKNFSDTQKAGRIDAEYFQPKYDEVIEMIKKYKGGYDELRGLVKIKDKNFTPKDNETYKYIELSNISSNGGIDGYMENFGNELPSRARRKVQKDDIIISSIEGSLESIALITENWTNSLCSTGFFVVNPDQINPETFLVLMKTKIGQLQLKRGCKGTILTAIGKDELLNITLPKIDSDIQIKIKDKIIEMYRAKHLSKSLLEIAKLGVEIAIEKNEEEAEKWIHYELEKIGENL